jgi:hypothetical protein
VLPLAALAITAAPLPTALGSERQVVSKLPPVFEEHFEQGVLAWQPTDPAAWRIESEDGNSVYHQFRSESDFSPPHRSPFNIALRTDAVVGDFDLFARVRSTHPDYDHRDACVIFGYQNPAQFYYVHFGKRTDDHANQIFVVDHHPRTKISEKTSEGTPWDEGWHEIKIERRVKDGTIRIFFDDMETPVMTARDERFAWGKVGIGSFDDTTMWDDVRLYGTAVEPSLPEESASRSP